MRWIRLIRTEQGQIFYGFLPVDENIKFAGWLITGKTILTKHGDPMKFLTFEDETGIVETVFFPKTYAKFCHMIEYGRPYILTGKVGSEWGAVTLSVIKAEVLSILVKT